MDLPVVLIVGLLSLWTGQVPALPDNVKISNGLAVALCKNEYDGFLRKKGMGKEGVAQIRRQYAHLPCASYVSLGTDCGEVTNNCTTFDFVPCTDLNEIRKDSRTTSSWNSLIKGNNLFSPEMDQRQISHKNDGDILKNLERLLQQPNTLKGIYERFKANYHHKRWSTEEGGSNLSPKSEKERHQILKSRLLSIAAHNLKFEKGEKSWLNGVNHLSDLTDTEFSNMYAGGCLFPGVDKNVKNFGNETAPKEENEVRGPIPQEFSWGSKENGPAVTTAKDQGKSCGSCWAHAAIAVMECAWIRTEKPKNPSSHFYDLSEQELLDCARETSSCEGGHAYDAMTYLVNKGVTHESRYPYRERKNQCESSKHLRYAQASKYVQFSEDETKMVSYLYNGGCLFASVQAGGDWRDYHSGLFDGKCGSEGHAVMLLAYGLFKRDHSNRPYWALKNSWGEYWGIKGAMFIPRGADKCGISSFNYGHGFYIPKA